MFATPPASAHALAVPRQQRPSKRASIVAPRQLLIANQTQPLILTFTSTRFLTTTTWRQLVVQRVLVASPPRLAHQTSPSLHLPPQNRHPPPPRKTRSAPEFRLGTQSKTGTLPRHLSFSSAVSSMPAPSVNGSTTGRFSTMAHRHPWPTWQVTCGCC